MKRYEIVKAFEFTSERRAMSIVVRDPDDPESLICFVKGADSSICDML
jgi:magnesium-transporting ATPase (P-type)